LKNISNFIIIILKNYARFTLQKRKMNKLFTRKSAYRAVKDVHVNIFVHHNYGEKVRPFATFEDIAKIANNVTNMAKDLKFD